MTIIDVEDGALFYDNRLKLTEFGLSRAWVFLWVADSSSLVLVWGISGSGVQMYAQVMSAFTGDSKWHLFPCEEGPFFQGAVAGTAIAVIYCRRQGAFAVDSAGVRELGKPPNMRSLLRISMGIPVCSSDETDTGILPITWESSGQDGDPTLGMAEDVGTALLDISEGSWTAYKDFLDRNPPCDAEVSPSGDKWAWVGFPYPGATSVGGTLFLGSTGEGASRAQPVLREGVTAGSRLAWTMDEELIFTSANVFYLLSPDESDAEKLSLVRPSRGDWCYLPTKNLILTGHTIFRVSERQVVSDDRWLFHGGGGRDFDCERHVTLAGDFAYNRGLFVDLVSLEVVAEHFLGSAAGLGWVPPS